MVRPKSRSRATVAPSNAGHWVSDRDKAKFLFAMERALALDSEDRSVKDREEDHFTSAHLSAE